MSSHRPRTFRPSLEALEDRLVLSAKRGHPPLRPRGHGKARHRAHPPRHVPGEMTGPQPGDILGGVGVGETPMTTPAASGLDPLTGLFNGLLIPGATTGPQPYDILGGINSFGALPGDILGGINSFGALPGDLLGGLSFSGDYGVPTSGDYGGSGSLPSSAWTPTVTPRPSGGQAVSGYAVHGYANGQEIGYEQYSTLQEAQAAAARMRQYETTTGKYYDEVTVTPVTGTY
jgi:hypothetical protein